MTLIPLYTKINLFVVGHPWFNRSTYFLFLLIWVLALGDTSFRYPWASSSLEVPFILLFIVPSLLLIAHIVFLSFSTWILIVALYAVSSLYAWSMSIRGAISSIPAKWAWWAAIVNILLTLAVLSIPLLLVVLTKPRRSTTTNDTTPKP